MICASSTACSSTQQRISNAGAQIGAAAARVQLEPWPAYCRQHTPHAAAKVGDELISLYKRERGQLDAANAKSDRCAEYYENYRQGLSSNGN